MSKELSRIAFAWFVGIAAVLMSACQSEGEDEARALREQMFAQATPVAERFLTALASDDTAAIRLNATDSLAVTYITHAGSHGARVAARRTELRATNLGGVGAVWVEFRYPTEGTDSQARLLVIWDGENWKVGRYDWLFE